MKAKSKKKSVADINISDFTKLESEFIEIWASEDEDARLEKKEMARRRKETDAKIALLDLDRIDRQQGERQMVKRIMQAVADIQARAA